MAVKFEVQMTKKAMFEFMLYSYYTSMAGILNVVLGLLALAGGIKNITEGDYSTAVVFLMFATLLLVGNQINMKVRAGDQVTRTAMFQKPLNYEMNEEGVLVSQDEQSAVNKWEDFRKVISTSRLILMYITKKRAIILPKECLGEQYEAVVKMISTHMPANKVKIRHTSAE